MSGIVDLGISKGLARHYFRKDTVIGRGNKQTLLSNYLSKQWEIDIISVVGNSSVLSFNQRIFFSAD